ncbi:hypothetical protein RMATCC62417_18561 [Rhizopus microsporus]|nr:hypothetical protein RMATCC62417_18561 [Rhizopus microsporus]
MYNIKKRFGTIYIKNNMTKEIEETILSNEKQMEELYDEIDSLKLKNKKLEEENTLLKEQNQMYLDIIEKNKLNINYKTDNEKYNHHDINNGNKSLSTDYASQSNNEKLYDTKYKTFVDEYDVPLELNTMKEHVSSYSFNDICNIPLPPITDDEEILLNPEENIESIKIIKEVQDEIEKVFEEYGLKDANDLINTIKTSKTKTEQVPTPSNSKDKIKNTSRKEKHKFENKDLPILKRCNVVAYKFNNIKDDKNRHNIEILDFIASEHKVMIRFNSAIAEKFDVNDKKIWDDIFKFKIENGELLNNNKTQFKYKVIRCKDLYDLYGENLSRFQIYVNYIGKLKPSEWKQFLVEFDKLYNETIKGKACSHKYKSGKICNRIDCKVKHKENI